MKSSKSSPRKLNTVDKESELKEDLQVKIIYGKAVSTKYPPTKIYWGLVLFYTAIHMGAIYGLQLCFKTTKWITLVFLGGNLSLPM